ncbi:MAG: MEDS domain-containing protein [Spirochaetaceae bacterium]|nr:MEDS domain-containing protein [Spirochaetaceae bacterium]
MNEETRVDAMDFASELPSGSCHLCLIFDDDEQREKVVSAYIAGGLKKGEQVRYFSDRTSPEEIRAWLSRMGVELPEPEQGGPFGISSSVGAYCPKGLFAPEEMIGQMLPHYERARKAGYRGSRSCGEMTWALKGIPGSERLLEYESLLNTVGGDFPHSGMCMYDARLFDGATLFKVLQVHPYMIAQGQIVRNPFYVRPEEAFSKGFGGKAE